MLILSALLTYARVSLLISFSPLFMVSEMQNSLIVFVVRECAHVATHPPSFYLNCFFSAVIGCLLHFYIQRMNEKYVMTLIAIPAYECKIL